MKQTTFSGPTVDLTALNSMYMALGKDTRQPKIILNRLVRSDAVEGRNDFACPTEFEINFDIQKTLAGQMEELEIFRSTVQEQQQFNSEFERQLSCAKSIQMITKQLLNQMQSQIQQQVSL